MQKPIKLVQTVQKPIKMDSRSVDKSREEQTDAKKRKNRTGIITERRR